MMKIVCADQEGGQGVRTPPENHKVIVYLSNTGLDPPDNHKATKSEHSLSWTIIGPPADRHVNGVSLADQ